MENNNKQSNTIAIVGFILSFFIAIAGLICSIIGLKKSKELNNGKGFSIAGIIISSIKIVLGILVTALLIIAYYIGNNIVVEESKNNDELELKETIDGKSEEKKSVENSNKTEEGSVKYYLNIIPYEVDSQYYYCTWNNSDEYCDYGEWKDAYSSSKTINSEISDVLLLNIALYNTDEVTLEEVKNENNSICNSGPYCNLGSFYREKDLLNKVYKLYNRKIEARDFLIPGGHVEYKEGYFIELHGAGNYPSEKYSVVEKEEKNENEYIIYERVLFIYDYLAAKDGIPVITKKTNYEEKDIIKSYSKDNINTEMIDYAKENINKGYLFKHLFKYSNETNDYYWYSTEIAE